MDERSQKKLARIMSVARAIKKQEAVNREDLARVCGGVAKETVSRYIKFLRDLGYPIVFDQKRGYHFYREDYTNLNDKFTREEIILLLMALDSLNNFGGSKIFNLQDKLLSLISSAADDIKEMRKKLNSDVVQEGKGNLYYINKINQAIIKEQQIKFSYAPAYLEQEEMECQVIPYGVAWQLDKCYLIAYDTADEKIINYRLDRIEKLDVTSEVGKIPDDFDLQEYVAQSWKMFFGDPQEVLLKFSQSLAPLVKDKFTEGFYEIVEEDEEEFVLQSTIRGIKGLKIWLLSLG
ncbi:MAG: helix-turn-helix transcriptional regulator, partial [Bacillota bacterium]